MARRSLMEIALSLVPACVCFGPLFIVIGRESLFSYVGAFMLMLGLVTLFVTVQAQARDIRALRER